MKHHSIVFIQDKAFTTKISHSNTAPSSENKIWLDTKELNRIGKNMRREATDTIMHMGLTMSKNNKQWACKRITKND